MSNFSSANASITLSFSAFFLSSSMIFSPLHKSDNIIVSVLSAFIFGLLGLIIVIHFFKRKKTAEHYPKAPAITAYILSCAYCLMMVTEMIKDVAYVAGRGISLFYYLLLCVATLIVSLYLCLSGIKGIFRFGILMFIPFLFLFFASVSGFISTKSFIFDISFNDTNQIISSLVLGAVTGIFFTLDSALYIFCFKKYVYDEDAMLYRRPFIAAYLLSFFTIAFYNLSTNFIFGTELTKSISDPDYALVKLIEPFDYTEAISALRIISFIIKSSIYIFCSSTLMAKAFKKSSTKAFILSEYLLIPSAVIILSLIDKTLGYGEFQNLIYPSAILLGTVYLLNQKYTKNRK